MSGDSGNQAPRAHRLSSVAQMLLGEVQETNGAVLTPWQTTGQGRFGLNGAGLAECPRCRGSFVEVLTGLCSFVWSMLASRALQQILT